MLSMTDDRLREFERSAQMLGDSSITELCDEIKRLRDELLGTKAALDDIAKINYELGGLKPAMERMQKDFDETVQKLESEKLRLYAELSAFKNGMPSKNCLTVLSHTMSKLLEFSAKEQVDVAEWLKRLVKRVGT